MYRYYILLIYGNCSNLGLITGSAEKIYMHYAYKSVQYIQNTRLPCPSEVSNALPVNKAVVDYIS